jgi:hypothetical protein
MFLAPSRRRPFNPRQWPHARSSQFSFRRFFFLCFDASQPLRRIFCQFFYRFNSNGTIDAICSLCFLTLATYVTKPNSQFRGCPSLPGRVRVGQSAARLPVLIEPIPSWRYVKEQDLT